MSEFLLSRRQWLASSLASGAAAMLPARVSAATKRRLPALGIQLYSLRGYARDEALRHAAELGFAEVEFYSGMLAIEATDEEIAATRKQVHELGMRISAHGVNSFGPDAAANRSTFEFAKKLGVPTITADPAPESLDSLDELVKEFDIRIAIHNHGPAARYNTVVDVLKAIDGRDERIGACADLGHYIRSGENPVEVIRAFKGRLYGVHLKDFAEMKEKTKGVILGQGHLDVEGVLFALDDVNFPTNGAFSIEYEENPSNPIADLRQCVDVTKSAMKKVAS